MSQQSNSAVRKAIGWVLVVIGLLITGGLTCNMISLAATGGRSSLGQIEATIILVFGFVLVMVGAILASVKPRQPK